MSTTLCCDIGYGDVKIAHGIDGEVKTLTKFPSIIAQVQVNELVSDDRVINLKNPDGTTTAFYVGDDANALPSESIIDVDNYDKLEYAAPLFIVKVMQMLECIPDQLVLGLSISQIQNSGHFKKRVESALSELNVNIPITLLPQGIAAKVTIDKHGVSFPSKSTDFAKFNNYVGCDIGFNTLDLFQVINGKTSTNLARGIPNKGVTVIAARLVEYINKEHKVSITLSEGKQCLVTQQYRRRGKSFNLNEIIQKLAEQYVEELQVIIENEFGAILDKTDSLVIFGGGSQFLKSLRSDFIAIPDTYAEYYNVISYYYFNTNQAKNA